jgi:hypothetical protein
VYADLLRREKSDQRTGERHCIDGQLFPKQNPSPSGLVIASTTWNAWTQLAKQHGTDKDGGIMREKPQRPDPPPVIPQQRQPSTS